MSEILHMPAVRAPRQFWVAMFGACIPPLFWVGQLVLSYWVTALACYGSDHPTSFSAAGTLRAMLIAFDTLAVAACLVAAIMSYTVFRSSNRNENVRGLEVGTTVEGRVRFLGVWGLLSSLWFFGAILFSTIASLGVPLCAP
ncbi:MAG TPA: hypothetical protein VHE09_00485 [Rhizomicrobium sp.]|nr:hypothetical protein [Rhizomicrobium sp.]